MNRPASLDAGGPGLSRRRLHVLSYSESGLALDAVRALLEQGFHVVDVHSPFPVHGFAEALRLKPTRIPRATLAGAALGASLALGFQLWSHALAWPLRIGGKDRFALPALVPVTFEVAVLVAAFATLGALLLRARLWPRPSAASQPHPRVSDDRFVVVVAEQDASFSEPRLQALGRATQAESVEEWRTT